MEVKMKLKYKKAILLTTMSTMGIGLLTLSVSNDKTQAHEASTAKTVQEAGLLPEQDGKVMSLAITAAPTVTVIPTPTPLPVYTIEEDENSDVEKLFKSFYEAKNNHDVEAIKKLLSDPLRVDTQDELQKRTQYIEEYSDIKTYTKKGYENGTYIVYVYHEIKFTGIKTPAPGLSKFYVITDQDKKLKIFSGEMEEITQSYYKDRNQDEDVINLIDMTNEKSKEAMKKDKDLKNFWNNINELANKSETQAKKATAE
jgi:hypothetical protein